MSFLNVIMLAGLAAAAIPFLIHLFQRQQVSTLDFSSVLFIKRLPVNQSRAIRLRHILLLIVRTLIIALVAMAFARPVLSGLAGSWFGSGKSRKTAIAIVIDSSYSMSAGGREASPFAFARSTAQRILEQLDQGDYGVTIFTESRGRPEPYRPTQDVGQLRSILRDAAPSYESGDIGAALGLANALIADVDAARKVVYLITDLQRNDWRALIDSTAGMTLHPSTSLVVIPCPAGEWSNLSLDHVDAGEFLISDGKTLGITAKITNRSTKRLEGRTVSVYLQGVKRGAQAIAADAGQSVAIRFSVALDGPGWYEGYMEVAADDIMADNRRYFAFQAPERITVQIIAGEDAGYFMQNVLRPSDALTTAIDVRRASTDGLNQEVSAETEVMLVDSGASLSSVHVETLKRFMSRGGGLMMFLGSGADLRQMEERFIEPVFGGAVEGLYGAPAQRQAYVRLTGLDEEHPVFRLIGKSVNGSQDAPRFYAHQRLSLDSRSHILGRFSNGSPALLEGHWGRGRALLLASGLDTRWTDLALKGFFVPFMHRAVRYLHPANVVDQTTGTAGVPMEVSLPGVEAGTQVIVHSPQGSEETLTPRVTDLGVSVAINSARIPGVYDVQVDGRTVKAVAVNVDIDESDTARLTTDDIRRMLPSVRFDEDPASGFAPAVASPESEEYEIWKSFIWLALLLVMAEAWLARVPVRSEV